MLETKVFGPCLVQKLKWGSHSPLDRPVATPLSFVNEDFSVVLSFISLDGDFEGWYFEDFCFEDLILTSLLITLLKVVLSTW